MNDKLINDVKQAFKNQFETQSLMVFSPGRINLIGEHTDYNDGFVFPAAIDKGIVLAIGKVDTGASQVYALDMDESHAFTTKSVTPLRGGKWRNYILGVVAELEKAGYEVGNFNAVFAGDIPNGAGLSSSAALENSFVFGLNELFNLGLSKNEMILVSQKAEHNFAGVKCGIMDQYASMFGVENSALLLDCRTVESETKQIDLGDYKFFLINTNVKHDLSESAYNDRRAVCEKVSELLQIEALRDATKADLDEIKDKISESDYEKALYVILENNRVEAFSEAIDKNDIEALGDLLYKSHNGLSNQYKVSCKELDFLVEQTKDNQQILGARMMGGGFGGCTINLISKNEFEMFKEKISEAYKAEFNKDCSIYSVKLSQGTRLID